MNGFNAVETKALLAKGVGGQVYKVADAAGAGGRSGGAAWGAKGERRHGRNIVAAPSLMTEAANTMANGQPFFVQLAKQVATTEGGG